MLAGLANFLYGQKHLHGHAEPKDPAKLAQRVLAPLPREHLIYLGTLGGLAVVWLLIQMHSVDALLGMSPVILSMHTVTTALVGGILWFMFKRCTKVERDQMFVVLAFIVFCLVFFTLYEQ